MTRLLKVLVNFGGKVTNEQRILPGEYEDDDPRLFGIADYLLNYGFAVRVDNPDIVESTATKVERVETLNALDRIEETIRQAKAFEATVKEELAEHEPVLLHSSASARGGKSANKRHKSR